MRNCVYSSYSRMLETDYQATRWSARAVWHCEFGPALHSPTSVRWCLRDPGNKLARVGFDTWCEHSPASDHLKTCMAVKYGSS